MKLDDHTQLINIGYYLGTKGKPLATEAFNLVAIERFISPPDCEPDMIFHSNKHKSTIILEAKSGNNFDCEQLKKFSTLTTEGLSKLLIVSAPEAKRCNCSVIYFAFEHCKDRLDKGIKACGVDVGLIFVNEKDGKISTTDLISPAIMKTDLNKTTIPLPFPTQYYPFTSTSSHLEILPEVAIALREGFSKNDKIAKNDFYVNIHPAWKHMNVGKQKIFAELIDKSLDSIRQDGLITIKANKIRLNVSNKQFQIKLQEKIDNIQNHENISMT